MPNNFFNLNNPDFGGILIRFVIDLVFLFILIRVIYFRYSKKEKFLFTFFLMGIMTFFICALLGSVYIEIGMGFTLFAAFAILRFRTRNFSIKDMAYIFSSIGISLINALNFPRFPMLGVLIINVIIILSAYFLERFLINHNSESYTIIYNNLGLLNPDKKQKLLKDISELTGKKILRIKIRRVDYRREVALIDIFFKN
jgi:hypothetical protein